MDQMISRRRSASLAIAIMAVALIGGGIGCNGHDSGQNASSSLPKSDAVDVTYYFLPG
jgi:hypothetical protein